MCDKCPKELNDMVDQMTKKDAQFVLDTFGEAGLQDFAIKLQQFADEVGGSDLSEETQLLFVCAYVQLADRGVLAPESALGVLQQALAVSVELANLKNPKVVKIP